MTRLSDILASLKERIEWTDDQPTEDDLVDYLTHIVKVYDLADKWSTLRFVADEDLTIEGEERRQDIETTIGLELGDLRRVNP